MKAYLIDPKEREGKRCFFCRGGFVKYIVETDDPMVAPESVKVYACNWCVLCKGNIHARDQISKGEV